ncbi:hypothetical protein [Euzebya rosea]|uniref:hypothetical protein n=1 Tax=Euzebya rosea TaxID=2052804 RepID=UPI000D3ECB18|nr:hypothetical protein [Euzebya rosea]
MISPRHTMTALVLALGLLLTACGGGGSDLVQTFVDEGATQEEAECFVDAVGDEQAQLLVDNIDADEPPEGIDIDALTDALIECGVDLD